MDGLLPALSIPEEQLTQDGSLDPRTLFGKPVQDIWFEIGFGNGEHLAARMAQHPENGYIGAEPFINGMSAFLKSIEQQDPGFRRDDGLGNIRVLMDDAVMLARTFKDNSLDGIYILNPDPWPKKRHHKRRIVRPETLDVYARILKPGGQLIMSTDVPGLANWMVMHTAMHPAFEWTANGPEDWREPPPGWVKTRYEGKGAKGAERMAYLIFRKIP